MDAGFAFMMKMRNYPVEENFEPLVNLQGYARKTGVRIIFSCTKRVETGLPIFRLRKGLVESFIGAAEEMNARGWVMRVEDAFRTRDMQNPLHRTKETFDRIVRKILWETNGKKISPQLFFRRMTVLIATIPKICTHMSGSAIDISVIDRKTGIELDRGAPYLAMDERTFMDSPFISANARKNRQRITECMAKFGFFAYPFEFWHFSKGDAYAEYLSGSGKPAVYGPVDLLDKKGTVAPTKQPQKPLMTMEEIRNRIRPYLIRITF
jgi:D-alanyl-D-alanine dipeptidase